MENSASDFAFTNVKKQLYATIIANWIVLSYGCIIGWLSPALPILFSDNTPLVTGPLTHEQLSWVSSMSSVGAIVGTFVFGVMSVMIGSKRVMTYLAFPLIAYWVLVHFGNTYYHLFLARASAGLTVGGMQSVVALYVSEISNDNIRGRLGSITPLARNVGVLIGYTAGAVIEYEKRPYIFVFFPIMYLFWLYSLPNTPQYYLHKGDYQKAESALTYYKGINVNSDKEKKLLHCEFERLRFIVEERKLTEKLHFSDFCNRNAMKGIVTSLAMSWFIQMTGSFLFFNYASMIFEKSGTLLDSKIASIILACVQIIGGIVSTQLGDTFGRKTTLFISLLGTAVGLSCLASYSYLRHFGYDMSDFLWLPVVCLSLIIFMASVGIIALAHIIAVENYPQKIRSTGVVLYSLCVSSVAFAADKCFPILLQVIHLHGCLLFFVASCCLGLVFVVFMKETKANLIMLAHGCIVGWIAPALGILASEETPLEVGPFSNEQMSWIGSINCLGALCGSFSFGYFISLMGCKRAMIALTVPCIAFWCLIYFGNVYYQILIARVFSGWAGGGIQTTFVLYISEMANDDIRGRLASTSLVVRNTGILMGYIFGATIDYKYIPIICVILPIIFAIIFGMIPNTPRYYLHEGQIQKAEDALKFYKGYEGKNEQEDNAIDKEFKRLKLIANERKTEEKLQTSDFFNRSALKGLGIGIALTSFSQFTGSFTITSYAVIIFKEAGTSLDPYVSSIMLAVALILSSLLTTYLADIMGRKVLIAISLVGSAIGLFATSLYHYLNVNGCDFSAFAWIPVVSLSFVIFISSLGIMPLAFICSIEYLPPKIRTAGLAIVASLFSFVTFLFVKFFPIMLGTIDLHGCMNIFGVGCIIGAVFVLFVLEETKGKSLDDVGLDDIFDSRIKNDLYQIRSSRWKLKHLIHSLKKMESKESKEVFLWTNTWNQYFATFAANLIIFSHGAIIAWVSPALSILASEKSPLVSGALTTDEISWIASINILAAMIGTLSLGYLISLMGSKRAILLLTIPIVSFWLLVYFGNHYYHLLLARVLSGFSGGGILTSLILYVSEISDDSIRGRLGSSTQIIRNLGVLVGFILSASVEYKVIPCISGIFPIIFAIIFVMLPNTPRYYLQKGQIQKAEDALKYYKGYKGKSKQEDDELYKEFERLKSIANERKTEEKLQASDFFNRSALKGLGIGIALTTLAQCTANFTITNYSVMIFEKAGTSLDPYVSSIMLGLALILGSVFSTYLADKLGRKFLNIMSLVGSALGLFALSLYHYLNINGYDLSSYQWVPVLSLSFVIFISSAGIVALSLVCSIEYLPPKIRTPGMAIICFSLNISAFTFVKLLPFLLGVLDLHGCMTIFGVSCVLGAIFIYFFVGETSGQSLDNVGLDEQSKLARARSRCNSIL
ncbi:uncharacterized protein LOC129569467 [Sitodiplosis mosellana]|uniref:uncharacterized protein LOC129569467 n=1 Tax=Sitodiplosis mosellana TaxID=263140 RepID=UPI00244393B0|nr:uncharacterized protein LOC129569467 [Sitodiplosis mosellana]